MIPKPREADTVVEIDDRGRAAMFVDGVQVIGITKIEASLHPREEGEIIVRINSRCVRWKCVASLRKPTPTGEVI